MRFERYPRRVLRPITGRRLSAARRARRALRSLTPAQLAQVMARWHSPNWHPPHEAHYLADLIHTATHS